ncbi:MAG: NADH-quinone oxidoreductase subunit C [bacterium]
MADEVVQGLKGKFGGAVVEVYEKSPRRTFITVDPKRLPDMAEYLYKDLGCRFSIATGMHMAHGMEILYHFADDKAGRFVNLRVVLDSQAPSIGSIATRVPAAEWIEREMNELLGIEFKGHPDMRHLLLTDDWPKDNWPLRRDWKDWRGGDNGKNK